MKSFVSRWTYRQPHWTTLSFLLISTLLLVFGVQGFENGQVNNFRDQSIQLPIIYSYADSTLFTRDFLLDARASYITLFYPAIGLASRVVPLDALMLALYVAAAALSITALYRLAETLFPGRHVALFAVMLWMAYLPNPGGDYIHSPFVTHTTFAVALELWALVFILRRRSIYAAILLGIAANINAMTSFFVVFMWLFALACQRKIWSWRLVGALAVMGVMSLPVLVWRFSLPLSEASLDDFVNIIRVRLWYAVFPTSISGILWVGFFALLALWIYSFRYGTPEPDKHQMVLGMVGGIVVLGLVGGFFSEVVPVEFMIELQLIRSTWLINLFVVLYLAHMIRALLDAQQVKTSLLAFALIAALAAPRWVIELSPPEQPTPYPLVIDLDTALARRYQDVLAVSFVVALIWLLVVIARMVRQPQARPAGTRTARRIVVWMGFAAFCLTVPGFFDSDVPTKQRVLTHDWEDTLAWIDDHTPRDARFVTPPMLDGFRIGARRAHIGDWKDGTVGIFHNGWAIEWYDRMLDLGFDEESFSFAPMTQDRLCAVVSKYGVEYAVVFRDGDFSGQPVFENRTFAVLPAASLDCPPVSAGQAAQ